MKTHKVLVIGGGTGGIMIASQLRKADPNLDIGLVEPADKHYYQPAFTLVGANTYKYENTSRPMSGLIPKGVHWIKDFVESIDAENNKVTTKSGEEIIYEYLVLSPGLKIDPSLVEGLPEALDKGVVCSVYTDPEFTWQVLKNFKGGTALFTQPTTPIKCGGAPQKIMYLAEDHFNRSGVRKDTTVVFATNGGVIFGVKEVAETLTNVIDRKDICVRYGHQLVKVDGEKKIAWYKMGDNLSIYNSKEFKTEEQDGLVGIHFDMLHLAPPQTAPDFIKNSTLSSETGWLAVDINTLQHKNFKNVFGVGDVAELPTAKTGAAIRKQAPIVVDSIMRMMRSEGISEKRYNGYSSCPLVTGYGKMALAEFDYDSKFTPDPELKKMLIFNSAKEHWRLWILKKYMLPYLYWNKMMKGKQV